MGYGCSNRYDNTHRGFVEHAQRAAVLIGIMLLISAATGFAMVWPLVVAAVCAVKLGAHARRVYGERDDPDADADADAEPEPEFTIV